jgi:hypothetical protein
LDSIAVSIKLTQCHYVCDGGILAFLIETVFAARIEACCSILGNDLSQCGYSPLMSGDYDASAHSAVSISHTINMGAREAGRHRNGASRAGGFDASVFSMAIFADGQKIISGKRVFVSDAWQEAVTIFALDKFVERMAFYRPHI